MSAQTPKNKLAGIGMPPANEEPDISDMSRAIMKLCEREAKRLCEEHGTDKAQIPQIVATMYAGMITNTAVTDLTGALVQIHRSWMGKMHPAPAAATLPKMPGMN